MATPRRTDIPEWKRPPDRTRKELTPLQKEYVEWLIDPAPASVKGTKAQWARDHGVASSTLRLWQKHPAFRKEMEARAEDLNLDPERIQKVVDAIYRAATDEQRPDVNAAKLYLQYVERFIPKQIVVNEDRTFQGLSDEELAAEVEAATRHLKAV